MLKNVNPCQVAQEGMTQLIEHYSKDCTPAQFVREYTKNSLEAIARTKKDGVIQVDMNWLHYELQDTNPYRISFTDNGDGMTHEEMLQHLNHLSSSGHVNENQNYGMGAKISSMTRNKYGLVYESWKNGEGSQIWIRYDEAQKAYGAARFENSVGQTVDFQIIDNDAKVNRSRNVKSGGCVIDQHGTRVTLCGNEVGANTMLMPKGVKLTNESWIYRTINERFFEIPENVKIYARIGYDRDPTDTKHNHLLQVKGQKATFEKHKLQSGTVDLTDSKIHWYILKPKRSSHGRESTSGQTAILFENEIFDRGIGRGNKAQQFGIIWGAEDVALYIEPKGKAYRQNTPRSNLLQEDGNPVPWERWQDEFKLNTPQELKDYMEKIASKTFGLSHGDSIKEKLKRWIKFYKLSRYRLSEKGNKLVDPDLLTESETGYQRKGPRREVINPPRPGPGDVTGGLANLLAIYEKADGVTADKVQPDPFPKLEWISFEEGTRAKDEIVDRAATFLSEANLIKANQDFVGFKDIIDFMMKEFGDKPGAEEIIPSEVRKVFEHQLIDTVTGALSLKGRAQWTHADIAKAFSEEALTTAVSGRYFVMTQLIREIKNKLGKSSMETQTSVEV
jgi:hypothetical protein